MQYKINGKSITVPEQEIRKNAKKLGITLKDAAKMWLEDEGYLQNDEQTALTEKAVKSGVQKQMAKVTANKKPAGKRERKADTTKESIIKDLAEYLQNCKGIDGVTIDNPSKLIGFNLNGEHYTINLIRNRAKK